MNQKTGQYCPNCGEELCAQEIKDKECWSCGQWWNGPSPNAEKNNKPDGFEESKEVHHYDDSLNDLLRRPFASKRSVTAGKHAQKHQKSTENNG